MHATVDEGPTTRDAPAVVLVHGQPGSSGDWYRVTPLLASDHRVVAVDRPGYGGGPPAAATDWAGNAAALHDLIDDLGLDRPVIVGASWGGGVAIELGRRAPGRLRGLVLAGSVGARSAITWVDGVMGWAAVARPGVAALRRAGPRAARLLEWSSGSRLDEEARHAARTALALWRDSGAWEAAAIEQRLLIRDADGLAAALSDVRVPAIVLGGRRDLYVPMNASEALADALPNARLVRLGAGHLLPLEAPEAVADAVRAVGRA